MKAIFLTFLWHGLYISFPAFFNIKRRSCNMRALVWSLTAMAWPIIALSFQTSTVSVLSNTNENESNFSYIFVTWIAYFINIKHGSCDMRALVWSLITITWYSDINSRVLEYLSRAFDKSFVLQYSIIICLGSSCSLSEQTFFLPMVQG